MSEEPQMADKIGEGEPEGQLPERRRETHGRLIASFLATNLGAKFSLPAAARGGAVNAVNTASGAWTVQQYDQTRGIYVDRLTTDDVAEAHEMFHRGPDFRVLDNMLNDFAADYENGRPIYHGRSQFHTDLRRLNAVLDVDVSEQSPANHKNTQPDQLHAALQTLRDSMRLLANEAGDVPEWNEGGIHYSACRLADAALAGPTMSTSAPGQIGIRLEGGVIQSIFTDRPMDVTVIDYDTEDRDEEDRLFDMPQKDGGTSQCVIHEYPSAVMPDECRRIRDALTAGASNDAVHEPEGMSP